MMRLASVLLVAVMLTTSMLSGTFAKYVTTGEVSDSARVAKFGVILAAEGSLFDKTYLTTTNTPGGTTEDGADGKALSVEANENVVAPGTKSDANGLKLSISGTPEVDVKIQFTFDDTNLKDVFLAKGTYQDMTSAHYNETFTFDDADYYPIVYTVKGKLISAANEATLKNENSGLTVNTTDNTMSGNLEAIAKAFANLNGTDGYFVDANTNLATEIGDLTFTWEWKYTDSTNGTITANDKKDTLLGDLAAMKNNTSFADNLPDWVKNTVKNALAGYTEGTQYGLDVALKLTVTVTQVD